jgi:hypothetical protein
MSRHLGETALELLRSVNVVRGFAEYYRQQPKPSSARLDRARGYAGDLPRVVQDSSRGCTIVMPAHRRQLFGGLVALTGLGLLAAWQAGGLLCGLRVRHAASEVMAWRSLAR